MSATAARLREQRGRLAGLSEPRLAWAAFALLALFALIVLYRRGVDTSFYYDEWDFIQRRNHGDLSTFIEPHNEHLSLVPVVIYKLLFATVGLDDYGPYRFVQLVLHVTLGGLVFAFARPRVGSLLAFGAAAMLLFLGAGFEDILWPFQIGFLLSLVGGLGALLMLERDTLWGDVGAAALLCIALASASLGIPMAIAAAVYLLWRPTRWRRLWVVAAPVALYAIWYLGYGKSAFRSDNITEAPAFTAEEVAAAASGVLGLNGDWGRVLAVAATIGLLLHLSRLRTLPRSFVMVLTAGLAFWVLTAVARAHIAQPAAPRYVYPGGLFLLLIAVEALRGWRPQPRTLAIVAVGVLAVVLSGLGTLRDGAGGLRQNEQYFQAELTALEIGGANMPPGFAPDQQRAPQVSAGPYLQAIEDIGSSPAYSEDELAGLDEGRKQLADGVFVRGYGMRLEPATARPAAPAPTVEPPVAAIGSGDACVAVRPGPDGAPVTAKLTAPPGGLLLRAPGGSVSVRRFASAFGAVPPLEGDPANAVLRIPRDGSDRPWHVVVQNAQRITACGLGVGP